MTAVLDFCRSRPPDCASRSQRRESQRLGEIVKGLPAVICAELKSNVPFVKAGGVNAQFGRVVPDGIA